MNYKKYLTILIMIFFIIVFLCVELCAKSTNTGKLIITISNLEPLKGILRLGLYNSRESYEKRKSIKGAKIKVDNKVITIVFDMLPPGFYAIMFYHDKNNNGKFDRFLGIPMEKYGFSNNVRPRFSAPDFDDVKFFVGNGQTVKQELVAQ